MKHYVFGAGIGKHFESNLPEIEIARKVVKMMLTQWDLDATIHGHYPDCKIMITEPDLSKVENGNIEILFESKSDNSIEFINCCMEFAREYGKLLIKEGLA